jgi:carbon-monoxide dehydrogenase large subunit
VEIVQGDTDKVPFGRGTAASRALVIGGSAILRALDKVVAKAPLIAGHLLEASPVDVVFKQGAFRIKGTDRSLAFKDVARAAYSARSSIR